MKSLLFTGATGFLGKNILPLLTKEYEVTTCGRSQGNDIAVDLATEVPDLDKHYDIVLHACGKAHIVPKTEEESQAFYRVNYEGTKNLCAALEKITPPSRSFS